MEHYAISQFPAAYQVLKHVAKTSYPYLNETISVAQFTIAGMLYEGKEVSQNTSEALKWFQKAKENGYPKALEKIDAILAAKLPLN